MNNNDNNNNNDINNKNISIQKKTKRNIQTKSTKKKKDDMSKKQIIDYIKDNRKNIIIIIALILFVFVTYSIFSNKIVQIDQMVHSYILSIRNDALTDTLIIITNISSAYSLIVISILLLAIIKNKRIPLLICSNLIFAYIINATAKLIFTRPRPSGINLIEESGFSYPSGHAMISMAYFGFIAYLIYKNTKNKFSKTFLIITLSLTILLIGFSRIYLGVHYLSDVIGGFLLSIIYLTVYIKNINLNK